jgi:hypothetical protein
MAPERILQQPVTTAVDIFSWGCLVAFARNGINPFGTGDFSVMSARLLHGDPQVGELPAPLDRLVRAALDKDPRKRPTARELLLTMVGGENPEAAVLGTLTSWQAPVPLPQGDTRAIGEPTQEHPSAPDVPAPPVTPPVHGAAEPPTVYGAGPPTAYDPGPTARGPEPTVAAGAPVESPMVPSDARPPRGDPPGGPSRPGRRRAVLAGATVIVVAAGLTGWLLRPDGDKPGRTVAAAGPAALPADPLLVRIDRQPGWPKQCHGAVGKLVPTTGTATFLLQDDGQCDILPRWSPDRRQIAFTRDAGGVYQLYVTNADGSGQPALITDQMAMRNRVAWSPDGKKIAIVAKAGGIRQISVVTVSAPHSLVQLTADGSEKDDPAWCGDRVAFWSKRTGTQQIYTVDARTPKTATTQVTNADHDVNDPAFSPDCTQMAYTDQPTKDARHIWVTAADGRGRPRRLTTDATRDMDPTWSPNGTWIAFARGVTPQPSIWAIRVADRHEQRLSPTGQNVGHPDWS